MHGYKLWSMLSKWAGTRSRVQIPLTPNCAVHSTKYVHIVSGLTELCALTSTLPRRQHTHDRAPRTNRSMMGDPWLAASTMPRRASCFMLSPACACTSRKGPLNHLCSCLVRVANAPWPCALTCFQAQPLNKHHMLTCPSSWLATRPKVSALPRCLCTWHDRTQLPRCPCSSSSFLCLGLRCAMDEHVRSPQVVWVPSCS